MQQKTFIEASCIYNTHIKKQIKKREVYFGLYGSCLTFIEEKRPNEYCLYKLDLLS